MQRYILVFFIFLFSVSLRIPFLGQKLEGFGHQEWLAGHTLIILKLWKKQGIAYHHYGLPYTFYRNADKYIPFIQGVIDDKGNGYYISYPPLAFYLLYGIMVIFSISPNEFFLQIATLCIQWITGLLLYKLIKKWNFSHNAALLTASTYFLLPITLRYHTQAYFCDIIAQIGIVLTLILYEDYLRKDTFSNALMLGFTLFLLTFTEWIGIFLTLSLIIHHLWAKRKIRYGLHYLLWIFFISLSIFFTLWIYAHIAGWNALADALIYKVNQRTVSDETVYFSRWKWHTYQTILYYYVVHYYPAIFTLLILGIIHLINKTIYHIKIPSAFVVITIAIFLHHFVFLNFTAENDFSTLKAAIPIGILWGILASRYRYGMQISYFVLGLSALYLTYRGIHREKSTDIQDFASKLVQLSPREEMLVLYSSSSISPQVMYYAERNVYMNLSEEKVEEHLKKYHLKKAVLLYTDWQYHIQNTKIIALE